jgi:2,3-bisphosphoglycerate-dependent phosphoglycerate mutase
VGTLGPGGAQREGSAIVPDLRTGITVLVVSHGNTLRALVKHLDGIGDEEIAAVEIAHGVPLLSELGPGMRSLSSSRYLTQGVA